MSVIKRLSNVARGKVLEWSGDGDASADDQVARELAELEQAAAAAAAASGGAQALSPTPGPSPRTAGGSDPHEATRRAIVEAHAAGVLSDEERDYFANAFAKSGFTGPINWYRNWTHNWETLEGVNQQVDIPTLFIGAVDDVIIAPEYIEGMQPLVTNLELHMLDNCGHWSQQEKPDDVNALMLDWLRRRQS